MKYLRLWTLASILLMGCGTLPPEEQPPVETLTKAIEPPCCRSEPVRTCWTVAPPACSVIRSTDVYGNTVSIYAPPGCGGAPYTECRDGRVCVEYC